MTKVISIWTHRCGFFLGKLILVWLFSLSSWINWRLRLSRCCDEPYSPMCSMGPEPGLYIILSQPMIGWRSRLRSSCRLFYLSLPIQLIRPACVYSISVIGKKSRLFFSQPVTWKMRNKVLKQSVYLCLFSLIQAELVGSWHGPHSCSHMLTVMTSLLAALFYHV